MESVQRAADEVDIIVDILYAIDAIVKRTYGDAVPLTFKQLVRYSKTAANMHASVLRRIIDEYIGLGECHMGSRWYKRLCVERKVKEFRESLGV